MSKILSRSRQFGLNAPLTLDAGEESIFSGKGNRAHGALDRVGVDLDAAAIKEAGEPFPLIERVADGLGDSRSAGNLHQGFLEPGPQRFGQRLGFLLSDSLAPVGAPAARSRLRSGKIRRSPSGPRWRSPPPWPAPKLAVVSPNLIVVYRKGEMSLGEMSLDCLMAVTVSGCTTTSTGSEAIPFAITERWLRPVSVLPVTTNFVDEEVLGATDIVLKPEVRA